jgi:exodeoxyribonuclease VII large subunit
VQGDGAAEEIAAAIETVNRLAVPPAAKDAVPIDCLVVTRGGGSLEDLWSFNEEIVVRAIAASQIPVVSAVGHEIDVTLADLAADVRALTPSEAAELVAPEEAELVAGLRQYQQRLAAALRGRASAARSRLDALAAHRVFRRPYQYVHDLGRRLDELELRSNRAIRTHLKHARGQADAAAARLESLSPLAVLGRGYSLTWRTDDGQIIRDATELQPGQQITTRFGKGQAVSRVEQSAE